MTRAQGLSDFAAGLGDTLKIDSTNNRVGIGSTQPTEKLDVVGVVSATSFFGNGANLTGITAGATLSAGSGAQRVVVTSLTSGTMTSAATDAELTYNSGTNTLSATTFSGALTGSASGTAGGLTGTPNIDCGTGSFTGDVDIADKIVHTGDTNTAIRFPAADTFTVETAGSEALRITSAGLVGIGTDNPTVKLTVSSDSPAVCDIHHIDGGTNDEVRMMLGALANNPPSNRGAGIAAVNNGAGHDLIVKCSASHAAGPTEKLRITSAGEVQIANGNLKFSTAGKGIDFSATGSGTGTDTSELLDDYEEGTWTPNIGGTATYHTRTGSYTKIGRSVTAKLTIRINALNSGSTTNIENLPFGVSGATGECMGPVGYVQNLATSVGSIACYAASNTNRVYFTSIAGAGSATAAMNQTVFQNDTTINATVTYFTT